MLHIFWRSDVRHWTHNAICEQLHGVLMSLIAKLMLLFTLIPILEITLLVRLHAVIGSTWPIVIVCCTAVLGTVLVRWQGRAALNKIK